MRSGRPRGSTDSSFAYDGDPKTSWSAGDAAPIAYAWFDLGAARSIAAIRWLHTAAGAPVVVQVSTDRERWTTVARPDRAPTGDWQLLAVDERARYVRLVFVGSDERIVQSELAEIEVYGPPDAEPVARRSTFEQDGGGGRQSSGGAPPSVQADPDADVDIDEAADRTRRRQPIDIETAPGEAECDGDGRCVVRGPRVDVRENCGGGGSRCVIDISVDGGLAVCDTGGSNRNRAGDGNGRRSGNGGTCDARASGGSVAVGDINR